jgi:CcmD family protein
MRQRVGRVLRTWTAAALLALASMAAAPALDAAQPPQPAAQDEFVPISEVAPEDQLPAAPLLIAAYAVAWLAIALYIWSVWKRLGRVEQELQTLSGRLSSRGR